MIEPASETWSTTYHRRGGPFEHDPKDRERPDGTVRPVGYISVDPIPGSKLTTIWHRLGPVARPADEVMHRFYLRFMTRLVQQAGIVAAKAFYPDEAGVLLAVVLEPTPLAPRMRWIGFNARAAYAAGALALARVPDGVLPEAQQ